MLMGSCSIAIDPPENIEVSCKRKEVVTRGAHIGDNRINIPPVIVISINSDITNACPSDTASEFEVTTESELPEISLVPLVVVFWQVREYDRPGLSSSSHPHFVAFVRTTILVPGCEGKDVKVVKAT